MVNCSIEGCKSRVGRDKISFYAPPAILTRQCEATMELSERRRKVWFERIYRPGFDEANAPRYVRVCANHFVNGKPSALFDVANADWAPCLNLGKTLCGLTRKGQLKRTAVRKKKIKPPHDSEAVGSLKEEKQQVESEGIQSVEDDKRIGNEECVPGVGCQTDITCEGFARLEDLYKKVLEENTALRRELATLKSYVGGAVVIEDISAHSDNEGTTAGLERVEVILKMEPEHESEPEPDPGGPKARSPPSDNAEGMPRGWYRDRGDRRSGSESEAHETASPKRRKYPQKRSKKYLCADCGQKFISKQALEIHSRTHTGERPFECPVCQRGFSVMSTLKAHMRVHTGERPFACQMCPRRFSEHGTLKCHMRTHTGEKPYECHICNKRFSENSTLRRHILTHTGERPFECQTCHSKFIQKYNLNNHIRRVHRPNTMALGL